MLIEEREKRERLLASDMVEVDLNNLLKLKKCVEDVFPVAELTGCVIGNKYRIIRMGDARSILFPEEVSKCEKIFHTHPDAARSFTKYVTANDILQAYTLGKRSEIITSDEIIEIIPVKKFSKEEVKKIQNQCIKLSDEMALYDEPYWIWSDCIKKHLPVRIEKRKIGTKNFI